MKKIIFLFCTLSLFTGYTCSPASLSSYSDTSPANPSTSSIVPTTTNKIVSNHNWSMSLARASERVTKKTFGQLINKTTSPVQPERFSGYHTGADFEILSNSEANQAVAVLAVCTGPIRYKNTVRGYGGVVVQECTLDNKPIMVLYGHLSYMRTAAKVGDRLTAGQEFSALGETPKETDGERKHLHLSFHLGKAVELRGYVQNKKQLEAWIDPCRYVCS